MRRHYVYYRVAAAELAPLVQAVQDWQRSLCLRHPGLNAELLRRPQAQDGQVTLMEVYGPLEAEPGAVIEAEAHALWPALQRHLEAFDLLG